MKQQGINAALQILTVCQGIWVLILIGFLMWHYVYNSVKNRILEKNALAMGISYSCLTVASMISSLKGFYDWNSAWQIIVIVGYALGDYVIVKMLFHTVKNRETKKRLEDYIEKNK